MPYCAGQRADTGRGLGGDCSFSSYRDVDKRQLLHVAYLHGSAYARQSSGSGREKKLGVCTDVACLSSVV